MVKVNGPMFSLDASGTLADAITFSRWKGRPYVRERVIPSNPRSGAQVGRRAMFTYLSQEWAAIIASAKATWQDLADELVASPFNAYVSENMKRWHNFLTPTTNYPAAEINAESDETLSAATWEENRIRLDSEITVINQAWGTVIYAQLAGAVTPTVGTAIILVAHDTIDTFETFWTPPSVGTWHFDMTPFTGDGIIGAATGAVNAVPP